MTILQALDRYYDRMAERGEAIPAGYSSEPIGVVIILSTIGSIVEVTPWLDSKGKRGRPVQVPKWFSRQGTGSTPYLFWDNTAYVLGVSEKDPAKTKRDHDSFKMLHLKELSGEEDDGLAAFLRFIENWDPERFSLPHFNKEMLAFNVAFRLEGDQGGKRFIHERPAAMALVERVKASAASTEAAFCLVRGTKLPVVRLHPKIKGVDGTAAAEVPLVSFNADAFTSYGKDQGFNAPTSEVAASRYSAALNRLLDRSSSRNRLKRGVGDATVVFWADSSGVGEAAAQAAEEFFAANAEPPEDDTESAKIRDQLLKVADGAPEATLTAKLDVRTKFHVLGLAPNAARLSVRYWISDDFGEFARRLADHHRDFAIDPLPWRRPPSVEWLLMKCTALQEKADNVPPLLAGEVMRAVLTGRPYPRTLMTAAITRLRAGDDPDSGWHAAAIRAVLVRDRRLRAGGVARPEDLSKEGLPVSLEKDNPHPAYQLGRLFAAIEKAQEMALGPVNAPIRDRYFGAASATPGTVFPLLMRGVQNHLAKLRKDGKGGWLEHEIMEIHDRLRPELPRSLKLEAQGSFVLGYYHQRKGQFASREAKAGTDSTKAEETDRDDQ